MKKIISLILLLVQTILGLLITSRSYGQTASVTVSIGAYTNQCCAGNTVPYTCYGCGPPQCTGCYNSSTSYSSSFTDPIPAGNVLTAVTINYYTIGGTNQTLNANINGQSLGSSLDGNTGSSCSTATWGVSSSSSASYPCGFPISGPNAYNYGGSNTLNITFGGQICINQAVLVFTYGPISSHGPPVAPNTPSGPSPVCPGAVATYSIPAVANTTGYTWTVPAGWTINSGQGTTSINVTAGSSGGSICVNGTNACGAGPISCLPVTAAVPSTPPASASANPNPICPSATTTLTASGGTIGTGASYNWYSGSCGGTLVGTGSSITVSPSSVTTYYVSLNGTCNTTSCASVTVNMGTTPAPASVSGNTTVCAGSAQSYTCSSVGGATSYNWTVPTGATITSGQGTTSINVTLGSSPGNICVTATGPCGVSAQTCTAITLTNPPAAPSSITGTSSVCPGSKNYSITAVGGATGYTWNAAGAGGSITGGQGTTSATVNWTTSGTGTVSVTANNACGSSPAATFTVLVNPLPTVSAVSTPTAVCSGSTATLTASGASTYGWAGGTTPTTGTTVTATPSSNQTYTITGTDANGCVNTATISLAVNPTPTVSLVGPSSQSVCAGGTVNGISFTSNPAGTISWTNTNTSLGGPLSSASGSGNIVSYTAPNVSSVTTGVVTANSTANGTGCPSTGNAASFTLTINPNPSIGTASVTPAPCGQTTGCINNVNVSGGAPTYSYSWNGGTSWSASSQTCNIGAGNYPLEVKDQKGCIATGTITVSSTNGPPTPTVSASSNNACVGTNVPLSISGSSSSYTYTWSDAAGATGTGTTFTVTNIGPAGSFTVSVTATDVNNCVSTPSTLTITVNPNPTAPIVAGGSSNPLVECQGSTPQPVVVAATGTVTSVPVWYNGTNWVHTGTSYTPTTTTPGTTIYTVIDSATATGCKNASAGNVLTVTVTINPSPTGPALAGGSSNPLVECQGSTPQPVVVATTGSITSVPVWYNGANWVHTGTSYTPTTTTPGTTIYTVIDSATATGCKNASAGNVLTVTVTIVAPPPAPVISGNLNNPVLECLNAGQSVTVATTGTLTSVPVWYNGANWVHTGTSFTPPSNVPGTTVYTVVDSSTTYGCKNASAGNVLTVTVTVNPSPTVTGNATVTASCKKPSGSVSGVNVSGGTAPYHYQWYNGSTPIAGDTLPSLTNVGSGTYSVQITDSKGCLVSGGTTTYTIQNAAVVAGFSTNPNQGPAPLTVNFTNTSTGATTYGWSFGAGLGTSTQQSPNFIYNNAGTYTVVLIATNGTCTDTSRTTIMVDIPTSIVIPNVFSPNGDNVNDEFMIITTGMKELTCDIYNRWGQKVYTLAAPNQSWDGRLGNGHVASEGTYFFMMNALGVDGKTYTHQGSLTLVK